MNKIPRKAGKLAAHLFSTKQLIHARLPVFLPFYHTVSDEKLPHILNYNYRNIQQFETELDFYLEYYNPISLAELKAGNFTGKVFHLSFDDGLKECAEIIAPILLRKGVPATFFINSAFVDNKELFHRYKISLVSGELKRRAENQILQFLHGHGITAKNILQTSIHKTKVVDEAAAMLGIDFSRFLDEQKPYLTTNQILDLQKQGFSIGAHSNRHPEFWLIDEEQQKEEIRLSFDWLDKNIRPEIKAFAFPYTDSGVPKSVFEYLHQEMGCDISFGTAGIKHDELENHFQRYPAEQPGDFEANLKAEIVYHFLRKPVGKTIVRH
jgi:peptidoglycan/xylan/chitin deacetylase (PgdA/CDA1 family)